jgi:protein ImuB
MPRILSVWLERWPIRRFLQAQSRKPSAEPVDPERPFVLAVEASGGPRVAVLNEAAQAEGVAAGETIADARAKARGLQVRPLDREADAAALRRLALWATRYTPAVGAWRDENGADGLFLDTTGASHLFGGEAALMADLRRRLAGFSLTARLALADTPGAGWALARYGEAAEILVPPRKERAAIEKLPVEALRLDPATRFSLRRLGLKRVGDLLDKPRAPLSRRFGCGLLLRIDQALGRVAEPINPIAPPLVYDAARQFLDPIVAQSAVIRVVRRLFEELAPKLERDGVGARALRLMLYRVDGETFPVELGLAAPTRNASYVERLFDLRLDRLSGAIDPGFGFETIRLNATAVERLRPCQSTLARSDDDAASDRAVSLIDALSQRFGRDSLTRLWPVASHIPERAVISRSDVENEPEWPPDEEAPSRPALLLREAEPADVIAVVPEGPPRRFRWRGRMHRVAHAQGPERIGAEWWRKQKPQPTRDYYIVEDEAGRRFWIFREGLYGRETNEPRWFVHGFFA